MRKAGDRTRKKESMREMKDKIEATGKKLKYFSVDLGKGSRERRELVNRTKVFAGHGRTQGQGEI